ncbi:hypothetical protein ABTZ03_03155 [Kitasatospora sp. NPDC096077]|uniref:hypothetical protein n=1 Tax=Kitasatospora sp. NPDC096077 TaxID=3155544 RepID=UPI0033281145
MACTSNSARSGPIPPCWCRDGRARIAADRAEAAAVLRQDLGGLAVLLAGRVIGEPVHTVAAERRTVKRFLTAD